MDNVISQAQATLGTLVFQRSTFGGINSKLSNVSSRLPTVWNLQIFSLLFFPSSFRPEMISLDMPPKGIINRLWFTDQTKKAHMFYLFSFFWEKFEKDILGVIKCFIFSQRLMNIASRQLDLGKWWERGLQTENESLSS